MEDKVEIAKNIAGQIQKIEGVSSAGVDDYNRYGSFQVVAYLDLNQDNKPNSNGFKMSKITREIKKILKETKQVSKIGISVDAPQRLYDKYTYRGMTDCCFKGYEKSYIMIDFVVVNLHEQVSITELLV
jgi:translation elongation factor EF-1beta